MNYLNVCVHSRSQDIVGFGHALVFVIALAALAVAALPCLGLPTTYSRISLASLPQSPVLVSLTHSLAHSLSLSTHISSNLLTHTHAHTLTCSLTHCSSTRQAFVRSFVRLPNRALTTTKKFSRTAAARCPFTRLGLDWPRVLLLAVCVCVGVGVAVCVALLYFVRACVRAVAVAVSVAVCVCWCWCWCVVTALCALLVGQRQRQRQRQQSDSRSRSRSRASEDALAARRLAVVAYFRRYR